MSGGGFCVACEDERGLTEGVEYASRREARQALTAILDDESVKALLRAVITARGLRLTQDGDNADDLDRLIGKVFTFNAKALRIMMQVN